MKNNKKAFTIVELIIVVVIIGILAAILIPNLVKYIDKANVIKDMELVRNLNQSLSVDAEHGKHETMQEAMDAAKKFGYLVDEINRSKVGNEILWDSVNDVFCYFDESETSENKIKYIPEAPRVNDVEDYQYYVIKDVASSTDVHAKYSTYVRDLGTDVTEITTDKGLDVGYNDTITLINYVNNSTTAKKVAIRTNGGTLVVNGYVKADGTGDEVSHYGYAEVVDVSKVASQSYHEKGTVPFVKVKTGHVVVESDGWVNAIHIEKKTETSFDEIKVSVKTTETPKFSRDAVTIEAGQEIKVCEVEVENKTEAIYLTMQGVYEQIKTAPVVNGTEGAKSFIEGAADASKINTVADQVSNNIQTGQVTVTEGDEQVTYTVSIDPETREIVVKDENNEAVDMTQEQLDNVMEEAVEDAGTNAYQAQNASAFEGSGTKADPFLIYDYATFQKITTLYSDGYKYFKVKDGVTTIDCSKWVPVYLNGSFDGNGVVLKNVTAILFQNVGKFDGEGANTQDIVVKNFTAEMNIAIDPANPYSTGAMIKNIGNTGLTTLKDITLHGVIEGYYNLGSFYNYGPTNVANDVYQSYSVVLNNCHSDVTLICTTSNNVGALIGHPYSAGNQGSLTITDCSYTGRAYLTGSAQLKSICAVWLGDNFKTINGEPTVEAMNATMTGQYSYILSKTPTKGAEGYTVEKQAEAKKFIVSICTQLTSYDENGVKIQSQSGITGISKIAEMTELTGSSIKVLDAFTSVELVREKGVTGVYDGVLKVYIGENYGDVSGVVRIQVNQYKANGEYVAAGTLSIASCTVPNNQVFADQPWVVL